MRELTLDDQQIFNQYLASSHRHWQFQPEFITIPSAYSFTAHYISVSYTHLTLPTNREV